MNEKIEPLLVFELPVWAKWWAKIDLNPQLSIQVLSLKYPRWESTFYPVFLNQENKPLFKLPEDLAIASSDGRIWFCCPDKVYFNEKNLQIIVDNLIESDHPRPAIAERQLISAPDFKAKITESFSGNFENTGDTIPKLSNLTCDFTEITVSFFHKTLQTKPEALPWPIEKSKKKKL